MTQEEIYAAVDDAVAPVFRNVIHMNGDVAIDRVLNAYERVLKDLPGDSVCGIYARSDNTRGVSKAPANELVVGALDVEDDVDQDSHELLNPRGVNIIRRFCGDMRV